MFRLFGSLFSWGVNVVTHVLESICGTVGWCLGLTLARMWGPAMKHGMTAYREEMARFLPDVLVHLRACNDMLASVMEEDLRRPPRTTP